MLVATVGKRRQSEAAAVHIDQDFGSAVDVDEGLKDGDKVIDNPPDALRAGDLVMISGGSDV